MPLFIETNRNPVEIKTLQKNKGTILLDNSPVNLELCRRIEKLDHPELNRYYIKFKGTASRWIFPSKTDRDNQYKSILLKFGEMILTT